MIQRVGICDLCGTKGEPTVLPLETHGVLGVGHGRPDLAGPPASWGILSVRRYEELDSLGGPGFLDVGAPTSELALPGMAEVLLVCPDCQAGPGWDRLRAREALREARLGEVRRVQLLPGGRVDEPGEGDN